MKSILEALGFGRKSDGTPNTFQEVKKGLDYEAGVRKLAVPFEGQYQFVASEGRAPGPRFPFVIGMNPQQLFNLEKGVIEGRFITPRVISEGDYDGTSHYFIEGKLNKSPILPGGMNIAYVMFEQMHSFETIDNFETIDELFAEFAGNVNFIHNDLVLQSNKNVSRHLFIGKLNPCAKHRLAGANGDYAGANDVYAGIMTNHRYKKNELTQCGLFTMERRAEPSHTQSQNF